MSGLTLRITSAADMPGYGVDPSVTISHISMPKLQMSDFTENILSYSDSVAIHLGKRQIIHKICKWIRLTSFSNLIGNLPSLFRS